MKNNITYNLPIWNGLKKKYSKITTSKLEIGQSNFKGIFSQKSKKKIIYDQDYEHMTPLGGSKYIDYLRKKKIDLLRDRLNKDDKILEIGGGDLKIFKYIPFKSAIVIDPAIKNIISFKNKKIKIIPKTYEEISLNEKFDKIILYSVIEHVDNLKLFIEKILKNLKFNGELFISIPIIDNQFLRGDFNSLLHEHTYYFTKFGIINLFNQYGLKLITSKIENDSGLFILKKKKTYNNLNENKLFKISLFNKIFKSQLLAFINFVRENNKILFYGATNGLNSLIYLSKLNKMNKIYFITDSDTSKIGKFLPASNKRIIKFKKSQSYNYVCISAQSFKKEILKDNLKIISTSFDE